MARKVTEELEAGAKCIIYEYGGFKKALDIYRKLPRKRGDAPPNDTLRVLLNVSLESALLHARNMLIFFRGTSRHDDEILVGHFASERPAAFDIKNQKETLKKLNTLLAHPSYCRGNFDHAWEAVDLEKEITTAWATFLRCLSQENSELRALFREAAPTDPPID
jgi:hypothetical protein